MKRNIKKQFWLNKTEAEALRKKARKACLTEAGLVRLLLRGYEPREKPDDRFYDEMSRINQLTDAISALSSRLTASGADITEALKTEIVRWHRFQSDVEAKFLTPEESNESWQ